MGCRGGSRVTPVAPRPLHEIVEAGWAKALEPVAGQISAMGEFLHAEIGAGRTVSEIATELGLSVKTVSTYRARVLEKMELRTSAELIHYAVVNKLVP